MQYCDENQAFNFQDSPDMLTFEHIVEQLSAKGERAGPMHVCARGGWLTMRRP